MYPDDCPKKWEYTEVRPDAADLIVTRAASIVLRLRSKSINPDSISSDSRPVHEELFNGMTPPNCNYFAGHYRGENFHCLKFCRVVIRSDPRVGDNSQLVLKAMNNLATEIGNGFSKLETAFSSNINESLKVLHLVTFACGVFEVFLKIHPYVNGNGHIARFLIWCILGRFNYWPTRWTIEPRPLDPDYSIAIPEFRSGNRKPLIALVLSCLVDASASKG